MSPLHSTQDAPPKNNAAPLSHETRKPLIDRLIDPSNVVFSLVFCQKARRDFEIQQAG